MLVFILVMAACGDDSVPNSDPVDPPDNPERTLPALGPPLGEVDHFDFGTPDTETADVFSEVVVQPDLANCCNVRFALPDPYELDDELSVVLYGDIAGIDAEIGLPLAWADGAWQATACVAINTPGTYQYEVTLPAEGPAGSVSEWATNPYVPTTRSDDGLRNIWSSVDSCNAPELLIHGQTAD